MSDGTKEEPREAPPDHDEQGGQAYVSPCPVCATVTERTDVPHVVRACSACGREMHILEPGEHGRGIRVQAGDRFVIPAGWLKLSANPLHSSGRLTRAGLEDVVRARFLERLSDGEEDCLAMASELEAHTDSVLAAYPPLAGLDINNSDDAEKIFEIMLEHQSTREFWALMTGHFLAAARVAISEGDTSRAVWGTTCAERCRSMMIFKESLEEVVWMGHSAKRVIDILGIWDANRTNSDEQFWQLTFNENSYVLSQIFAVPVVFIQGNAYVGGMALDRSDGRFVDYLFSTESSREAILVEIKTPTTPLIAARYRGNRPPSRDLSGSIIQVRDYRAQLARNLRSLTESAGADINAFNPRCAVIIGNAASELLDDSARRSFELFRGGLSDVEIITYDELFRKVEILAELFSLKRTELETS